MDADGGEAVEPRSSVRKRGLQPLSKPVAEHGRIPYNPRRNPVVSPGSEPKAQNPAVPWNDGTTFAETYAEVQQFYARQTQLLDSGDAEGWALTFAEDGTFAPPSLPEPICGRVDLAAGLRAAAARLVEAGEVHRHLFSMTAITEREDGSLGARSYTQIIATPRDGAPRLHLMCVCEDVLTRQDGALRLRERRVTRDDWG